MKCTVSASVRSAQRRIVEIKQHPFQITIQYSRAIKFAAIWQEFKSAAYGGCTLRSWQLNVNQSCHMQHVFSKSILCNSCSLNTNPKWIFMSDLALSLQRKQDGGMKGWDCAVQTPAGGASLLLIMLLHECIPECFITEWGRRESAILPSRAQAGLEECYINSLPFHEYLTLELISSASIKASAWHLEGVCTVRGNLCVCVYEREKEQCLVWKVSGRYKCMFTS